MMAHPSPSTRRVVAIGGGAMVRSQHMDSVLLNGVDSVVPSSALNLRKPEDEMGDRPSSCTQSCERWLWMVTKMRSLCPTIFTSYQVPDPFRCARGDCEHDVQVSWDRRRGRR